MTNEEQADGKEITIPDAEEVIRILGGIRPAAAKLGVPVTTVQGWKNRGRIPDNRHDDIRRTLSELGVVESSVVEEAIDTPPSAETEAVAKSNIPESTSGSRGASKEELEAPMPKADSVAPATPLSSTKRQGSAMGMFAVLMAALSLLGVAVMVFNPHVLSDLSRGTAAKMWQQDIGPNVGEAKVPEELEGRIEGLADNVAKLRIAVETLSDRVKGVEGGIVDIAGRDNSADPQVSALRSRVDQLTDNLDGLSKVANSTSLQIKRDAEQDRAEQTQKIQHLNAEIASLRAKQNEVSRNVSDAASERAGGTSGRAALLLAIGQLEARVQSGERFRNALLRAQKIAGTNAAIVKLLGEFEADADAGVPSNQSLQESFSNVSSILSAGRPPAGGWTVMEGAWAQVKATIGLRRIGAESQSPITLTERALQQGNLRAALEHTKGYGAVVDDWRQKVMARQVLQEKLELLHKQAAASEAVEKVSQ